MMRLPRDEILTQIVGVAAPNVIALEAPKGYGKSWLLRRARRANGLWIRGTLEGVTVDDFRRAPSITVDDAHRLARAEIDQVVTYLEASGDPGPIRIAGRRVPDAILDAVRLADGMLLDAFALSLKPDEIAAVAPDCDLEMAERMLRITDGQVHATSIVLTQSERQRRDMAALATRVVQGLATTCAGKLAPRDSSLVGIIARFPSVRPELLNRCGDDSALDRLIDVGIPLVRNPDGGLALGFAAQFRRCRVDHDHAVEIAPEVVEQHPIEALNLLLDVSQRERAAQLATTLPLSTWKAVEPRATLDFLARLGSLVDENPDLLIARALATHDDGRRNDIADDLRRAAELAEALPAPDQNAIRLEVARVHLHEGRTGTAQAMTEQVLSRTADLDDRTAATAYDIVAKCLESTSTTANLHGAEAAYRGAIRSWEAAGEAALARLNRYNLALGVLQMLGRFDDALHQVRIADDAPDLTMNERLRTIECRAMILTNAGAFDEADRLFQQLADHGRALEQPRAVRNAAWGRLLLAGPSGDREAAWQSIAEIQSALPPDSDRPSDVLIDCDAVLVLGVLGDLDTARKHLRRAERNAALYPNDVAVAKFLLDARQGILGDLDDILSRTLPINRWRVLLLGAYATAVAGDLAEAGRLWAESERERIALHLPSAIEHGERTVVQRLRALLEEGSGASEPEISSRMRFGVLGALDVTLDGVVQDVGPPQRRMVLAVLLSAANQTVSTDRLIDVVWGDAASDSSAGSLQAHISRLRRVLGSDRILRQGDGYRLRVEPGELDADRFDRLADEGLELVVSGDNAAGRDRLAAALELWRGDAYEDFTYHDWARLAATRLDEQRLSALEARLEADLALGRHRDVIGELEVLTHAHPTRERFWALLMTALHRSGRQRDALNAYRSYRDRLVADTGLEPSPRLRDLELQILNHDDVEPAPAPAVAAERV